MNFDSSHLSPDTLLGQSSLLQAASLNTGRIIVIAGPSGVGKGTVCKRLLEKGSYPLMLSISATTRAKRPGEVDGESYFFMSRTEFETMAQTGDMLEWAEYNGNLYGTPKFYVEEQLAQDKHVLLEIETQGALMVKALFPLVSTMFFLHPPSMDELQNRLSGRGANSDEDIDARLKIAEREFAVSDQFDYQVINDDVERCCQEIETLLKTHSPT